MSFSIRRFFSVLYLSVVIEAKQCLLYGKAIRNGKVIKIVEAKFDNENPNNPDEKIIDYIKRQQKEYKWVYIALFLDSMGQGVLPCDSEDDFKDFDIDIKNIAYTKVAKNWFVYADLLDIASARAKFKDFNIDLLYSPMAILHKVISQRDDKKNTLYIYNHKDSFAICIVNKKELKFGSFVRPSDSMNALKDKEELHFAQENIDDIDNFITEVDNSLETFEGLEPLDGLFPQQQDGDEFEDLDYDINMPASKDVAKSVSIFGRDMNIYQYINAALREFYSNPAYDSDFIEQIVVIDNDKTSATFLHYIETELFVETAVYQVETLKIMTELMMDEVSI